MLYLIPNSRWFWPYICTVSRVSRGKGGKLHGMYIVTYTYKLPSGIPMCSLRFSVVVWICFLYSKVFANLIIYVINHSIIATTSNVYCALIVSKTNSRSLRVQNHCCSSWVYLGVLLCDIVDFIYVVAFRGLLSLPSDTSHVKRQCVNSYDRWEMSRWGPARCEMSNKKFRTGLIVRSTVIYFIRTVD